MVRYGSLYSSINSIAVCDFQIKLASVKLAMQYMKRVSAELEAIGGGGPEEEELIVQGVKFAFRVHQVKQKTFDHLLLMLQTYNTLVVQSLTVCFCPFGVQFAGGFDAETMRAFQELRDKARSCHIQCQSQTHQHKLIFRSTHC